MDPRIRRRISLTLSDIPVGKITIPRIITFGKLLLFGGFFLQSDSVPVYFIWLKYMSWFYYGAENLYVTQWENGGHCVSGSDGIPQLRTPGSLPAGYEEPCVPKNMSDCSCLTAESEFEYHFVPGTATLERFSYNSDNYWRNVLCLCALAVGYRSIGYIVLAYKFRKTNR